MSTEVKFWQGEFGNAYHQRNRPLAVDLVPVLDKMLEGIEPGSVLEPGCGLGVNLVALRRLGWQPDGVEPNLQACEQARFEGIPTVNESFLGSSRFLRPWYDLVVTSGFLIHVPPAEIRETVDRIVRLADRYVLVIEYAAPVEDERDYRGNRDVLWARPYGELFGEWGGLKLVRHGLADPVLQPGCTWWLLRKS